jgi:hypothetical protein
MKFSPSIWLYVHQFISVLNMSFQIENYVTHLPEFQVVICQFSTISIPPKDPLRHYERHHTSTKEYPIDITVRRKIAEYMGTLVLLEPDKVIARSIPWAGNLPKLECYAIRG